MMGGRKVLQKVDLAVIAAFYCYGKSINEINKKIGDFKSISSVLEVLKEALWKATFKSTLLL